MSGILSTNVMRSRVESVLYWSGNPAPATGGTTWQPRDTVDKGIQLPHGEIGVLDQMIEFHHNLKNAAAAGVTLLCNIRAILDNSQATGGALKFGPIVWSGSVPSDGRWFIGPERGAEVQSTGTQEVIQVTALRGPFNHFEFRFFPQDTPTTGDVYLRVTRRY